MLTNLKVSYSHTLRYNVYLLVRALVEEKKRKNVAGNNPAKIRVRY